MHFLLGMKILYTDNLSEQGAAMVSTGQNQGECACRKDTSLKVQNNLIANNNDNFEYALAA